MAKEWNVQDNRAKGDFCGDIWGMLQMRIRSNADGSCAIESREFWPRNGVRFLTSLANKININNLLYQPIPGIPGI